MIAEYNIYIGIELSGFILIFSLLVLTASAGDLKKRINFFFFLTVLFVFLGILSDWLVELMIGQTSPAIDIAIRVLDGFSYSSSGLQIITFTLYLYEYLSTKTVVSKKPFYFMVAIGAVNAILAIIASFTQLYVHFDIYNNYIRQETFWISGLLPALTLIIFISITLRYIRLLKIKEWVSLLLYTIIPIICYVLEMLLPNIYLAAIGVSFTLFFIYVNLQVELKAKLKDQEMELTNARISVMLSQIQPHFLYNSLASIEYLCVTEGAEQSATAVRDFSKYLRSNMDSITYPTLISFEKELQHVSLYLSLEKRRFDDLIQAKYDIQVTDFALPPLTLQPIVENAVRHGITQREDGGMITIHTEENESFWHIVIADNGIGFDTDTQKEDGRSHIGIANVRSRLKTLCNGQLLIESTPGIGTTATVLIPKWADGVSKIKIAKRQEML